MNGSIKIFSGTLRSKIDSKRCYLHPRHAVDLMHLIQTGWVLWAHQLHWRFWLMKKRVSNVFSNWVSWLRVHFYFRANCPFKKKEICRILWSPLSQNTFGKWWPRIHANAISALGNVQHQRKEKNKWHLTIFSAACNHHFWIPTFEAAGDADLSFQGESLLNIHIQHSVRQGDCSWTFTLNERTFNASLWQFDWAPRPNFTVVCHHQHPMPPDIPSVRRSYSFTPHCISQIVSRGHLFIMFALTSAVWWSSC